MDRSVDAAVAIPWAVTQKKATHEIHVSFMLEDQIVELSLKGEEREALLHAFRGVLTLWHNSLISIEMPRSSPPTRSESNADTMVNTPAVSDEPTKPWKQRPEDQVLPTPNTLPYIHDIVAADVMQRKAVGIKRYGVGLQPFNGRSYLKDIYEELLDAACYVRGKLYEEGNAERQSK